MSTRERHKAQMATPAEWPHWPILPVKRVNPEVHQIECGVMFAVEGYLTTVCLGFMWIAKGPTIDDAMNCFPEKLKYDDLDAVLDAGWVVDR